jgi:WD40-like Beta Propeller Repeat
MEHWSPDGKSIVYVDWRDISMVSADGGTPEPLIHTGDDAVAPDWSPDGKSIYFNFFPTPNQPLKGIRILDLATRTISMMPGGETFYVPIWSPDGKYLVAILPNPSRMMLYTAETKTWKELKLFDAPWGYWIWSNDSKSLVIAAVQGKNGIYRLTVPDAAWEKVSGLEGVNAHPVDALLSLTPDGQPAIMNRTGVTQIYSLHWKH